MDDEHTELLASIARYNGGAFLDWMRGARANVMSDFVALDPDNHIGMVQLQAQAASYENIISHLEGCKAASDAEASAAPEDNEY